jgi:hypothetical protein
MRVFLGYFVLLCCLTSTDAGMCQTPWKTFHSTMYHYTVQYPASWYPLPPDRDALNIVNFPPSERVHGVVIKNPGAEITAGMAPSGVTTIDQWLSRDARNDTLLEDREIPISRISGNGCKRLRRAVTRSEIGEGRAYQLYTFYYCSTDKGLYSVLLANWEGDPHQEELRATALRVVRSLRAN